MINKYLLVKRSRNIKQIIKLLTVYASLTLVGQVSAQVNSLVEFEVDRDASELNDLLTDEFNPKPDAALLLDTAMVITSVAAEQTLARCYANDKNGETVGRIRVRIPAGGVRFFLASDIIEESGFIGSVICTAPNLVIGTEVLLGVVNTSIEVHQQYQPNGSIMLFPVTAMK